MQASQLGMNSRVILSRSDATRSVRELNLHIFLLVDRDMSVGYE